MRRLTHLLLAALLVAAPAPALAAPPAAELSAPAPEALTTRLRDALHSGDLHQVRRHFHGPNDPALAYLATLWDDMRAGRLDPVAWEVTFAPYYQRADAAAGQLSIAARRAAGTRVGRRFDVSLVRRGNAWLIGEAIRYDRPETRLVAHDLAVDLTGQNELAAEDTMTLEGTGPDRHVYLRLHPTLQVASVRMGAQALPFVQHREVVHFERPEGPGPFKVAICYAGALPAGFDFVRPDSAMLRSELLWYPREAIRGGFTPFLVQLRVAPGMQAIAVGEPTGVEEGPDAWIYRFATQRPVEGMSIYAGRYARHDAQAGEVALSAYAEPGKPVAPVLLADAARALDFYGDHFGRYPFRKLALVETEFPGGYGATSAVALPRAAFDRPAVADEFLAHEIAHNWTDMVAYKGPLGERGFMAEGVASYMDLLYHLHRDGVPSFRKRLHEAQRRYGGLLSTGRDLPMAEATQDDRAVWQALTYDKASLVLHMLRRQVGDKAFDQGLRDLYTLRAGQEIDLATFQASFEKASKQHLGFFFQQWLTRAGVPAFTTEGLEVKAVSGGQYELAGVLVQGARPYVLDVPLVVVSGEGETLYQVPVKSARTPFRLRVPGRPRVLLIDPLRDALLQADGPIPLH
jgi:hypothetical protein